MKDFQFTPSHWAHYQDVELLERIRRIRRSDIEKHPNPDFHIQVVPDEDMIPIWIADMYARILEASKEGRRVVMILPNPAPAYRMLARLINRTRLDCRHLVTFNMDEWADEEGNVAPESYRQGFMNATLRFLYKEIDADLRPPRSSIKGPTTQNISSYSELIEAEGGADICYSGPGWTGHIGFVEPGAPEFEAPLEDWKRLGARIVTLHPLTLAQNSLHGSFGRSGDISQVPPRAATIGPRDVLACRHRMDMHGITTAGTHVAWQRMASRLSLHGPVTPRVPTSILQTVPTEVYVTETLASDIETSQLIQY